MSSSVSVIIPTYNGIRFLREALQSVYAQTLLPQEILLVDDVSTDGTPELIESLLPTSPVPLRLLRLERNSGGPAQPINVGVGAATGEYIAILDQDDLFLPQKLQVQATVLAEHPDVTLAFSFSGRCDEHGKPWYLPRPKLPASWGPDREMDEFRRVDGRLALRFFVENACFGNYTWGYPGILFRREDWKRKGGCDERLRIASDLDMMCWFSAQGALGFSSGTYYYRREHAANVCKQRLAMFLEAARVQARYLRRYAWLLEDQEYALQLRGQFFRLITLACEAGNYGAALQCIRLLRRTWGLKFDTVHALTVHLRDAGRNDMSARLNALQVRCDELHNNYDHLQNCYVDLQTHYDGLAASEADLQASRSELQTEYDSLVTKHSELFSSERELQLQHDELQAEQHSLQVFLGDLQAQYDTLSAEHGELQLEHDSLLARQDELQSQNEELQAWSSDVAAQADNLQVRHEQLQADQTALQAECEHLQKRQQEMALQIQQLLSVQQESQLRENALQQQGEQLQLDHDELQARYEKLRVSHDELQAEHLPYTSFLGILGQVPRAGWRSVKQRLSAAPSQDQKETLTTSKPVRNGEANNPVVTESARESSL